MHNKYVFAGLIVLATIVVLNQAKKDPNGIFGKLAGIGG